MASALVGVALSGLDVLASERPTLPTPTGQYAVGRVSYAMTDEDRPEPLSAKPNARRKIMVHVWYPADGVATKGKPTAPYLPGFNEVRSRLRKGDVADMFRPAPYTGPESIPETSVVENAPVARGRQKFPLLLFSHGWGNPTFLYTAELEDIVSHGYVVAAIDHPYDTTYTLFPDGDATFFAQDHFDSEVKNHAHGTSYYSKERVEVMAKDNQCALTQLVQYVGTRSLGAPFLNRVDLGRIGAFGHSIGGLTAARTCQIDPRIKACMDQDSTDYRGSPFIVSDLTDVEKQPFFLFVASSADVWSPRALNPSDADLAAQHLTRTAFDANMKEQQENQTKQMGAIAGGSYRLMLFDLPGFIHRSFTDQTLLASQLDREQRLHNFHVTEVYTLAFFDKYLKGNQHTILDTGEGVDARAKLEKFPPH